jgi:hypothetical protein
LPGDPECTSRTFPSCRTDASNFVLPPKYFLSGWLGGCAKRLRGDAKRNSVVKCLGLRRWVSKLLIPCEKVCGGEAEFLN